MGKSVVEVVPNFAKLYLQAQMELEGAFGFIYLLRELIRSMRTFIGLYFTEISEKNVNIL